jgi:hypothetical protein
MRRNMKNLEERITALEDIEKIKVLQQTYGYYMDNLKYDDVIDLFSDNAESAETDDTGVFLGKTGIRSFYKGFAEIAKDSKNWLSIHLQLQGVVHLGPNGKTAQGRWQCLMLSAVPLVSTTKNSQAMWGAAVYENQYVKENDIWKIKKLVLNHYFMTTFEDGWAKTPRADLNSGLKINAIADILPGEDKSYISGYSLPYHFKNPVTGK